MLDLLLLTVIIPLLGSGGILLSSSLFSRRESKGGYIRFFVASLAIAIVVLAVVVAVEGADGRKVVLASPYPASLAESSVEMRWDATLWALGLSLSAVVGILLLDAAGSEDQSFHLMAASLVLLVAGLAALSSANPFTTIVCWALYDLACALARLVAGDRIQDVVRCLALGTASGMLLWAGVLIAKGGIGGVQWALMPAGGPQMTYWVLAGFLRLGAYPLHFWLPRSTSSSSSLIGALTLSPILGWGLWVRLALVSDRAPLVVGAWMVLPALLTMVGGGVLAWTASSWRESRPWISMGVNGGVFLATVLAWLGAEGQGGRGVLSIMTLGSTSWMLGTAILFLGGGLDLGQILQWKALPRVIPLLVGALSLIGAPATIGFVDESFLMVELVSSERWVWGMFFLLGQAFLVAAVMRWLVPSEPAAVEGRGLLGAMAHGVSLIGLAASLAVMGVLPGFLLDRLVRPPVLSLQSVLSAPDLAGWLLWGGAILLGGILAWLDAKVRPRISLWLNVIHDVLVFDWGYGLLVGAFERGFDILRVAGNVLSGRGALLWSCVVLLVLILIVGG